jgi:hypothetical protein
MKVLLLTGFFDENFVYREHAYAQYFEKNNIEYTILTSTLPLSQKKQKNKPQDSGKYNIVRKKPFFSFRDIVFFNVSKQLKKINPDIIHLFDAQQGIALFGILFSIFFNKIVVYDHELQGIPSGKLARIRFYLLTYPILQFVTSKADKIRCVTPGGLQLLKRVNPKCESKITLEPLGYNLKEEIKVELPFVIPATQNLISMTGYFDIKKNIKPILAAFVRSNSLSHNAYFVIIGPIFDSKVLKFIKKHNRIIHYDQLLNQEELELLLKSSKINIWPKSTSTIFEALKFDNYVILPFNDQTSHLNSLQIKLIINFSYINIKSILNNCFISDKEHDNEKFNYKFILEKMVINYKELYEKRVYSNRS